MTAAEAARAFGVRDSVEDISLSPDRKMVAMVVHHGPRGSALQIADFASGKPPQTVTRTDGNTGRLTGCNWASTRRLICSVYFIDDSSEENWGFSRLFAVNSDGSNQ